VNPLRKSILQLLGSGAPLAEYELINLLQRWYLPNFVLGWLVDRTLHQLLREGRVAYLRDVSRRSKGLFKYSLAHGENALAAQRKRNFRA
jgi:hypothetical protein